MMTTRLYYTDSRLRAFDAVVRTCDVVDGRPHVRLDRTAFFPASGGQPFDTGRMEGAAVVDVFEGEDGDVVHVLSAPLEPGATVHGEVDWPRRLDHMQQHSGQHILSAAFDRLFGVPTVSCHLGTDASTIDLSREVTAAETDAAEAEANRVVWENRAVGVRFVSGEDAARLRLRKDPTRSGTLRIVEVEDFDASACGGTHVTETGVVGVIAVSGVERVKGASRVSFVCGGRALRSHRALREVVLGATRSLSVTAGDVPPAIERLLADARESSRLVRRLQDDLSAFRGAELRAEAETIGPCRGVLRLEPELDGPALKALASAVVRGSGLVAAFAGRGTPVPVVIARSTDVSIDAAACMRDLTAALGGRGGGTPALAQGGVPGAPERVVEFIRSRLSRVN
jgi:alanyl-tRNA synthetase